MKLVPLEQLAAGETAEIAQVQGGVEQVRRLSELGLRTGVRVAMVHPGSPCIVRLGDVKLAFRTADLVHVFVRPGGPS